MKRPTGWALDAERELWTDICAPRGRASHPHALYWFVRIAWGTEWFFRLTGKRAWLVKRVHQPYLDWLQNQIIEWKESRLTGANDLWLVGVFLPRGFGKTVTCTKAAALWSHLDEPNLSVAIGSEVHPKAKAFLGPIKEALQGTNPYSWFAWLYGKWYDKDREWTNEKIEHGYRRMTGLSEPSFDTFGTDKGITGYHPNMVIVDDPLSATKLKEGGGAWLDAVQKSFAANFKAISTDGLYMLVGTRYLVNDVIGTALGMAKGDGILSWDGLPMPYPEFSGQVGKGKWRVYFLQGRNTHDQRNYPEGEPVLPEVWTHERMLREEKKDSADYNAQIMNMPASGEHMPLVKEQIEKMRIRRDQLPPIEYATIHCDTAYKTDEQRKKGDNNVIAVVLHPILRNGFVYFDGAKMSNDWRSEEFHDALIATLARLRARMIRVRVITADKNPGGVAGLWSNSIRAAIEGAKLRVPDIVEMTRSTDKTSRIRAGASYWVEGYMKLIEDAENRERLEIEMLNIGYIKPDDLGDAMADVWGDEKEGHDWWRKPIYGSGRDPDEGELPSQPGDYALRNFSKPLSNDELREMYDSQHPDLAPPETNY